MTTRDGLLEAENLLKEPTDAGGTASATDVAAHDWSDDDLHLDLLLPSTLPSDLILDESERESMRKLLTSTLEALQIADKQLSAARLKHILSTLPHIDAKSAPVVETFTPAKPDHVDDFDSYFRVNRITSDMPALSIVRGLLQTSSAIMDLFARSTDLPAVRVEQQLEGLVTYTHLLSRTFNLGELQ